MINPLQKLNQKRTCTAPAEPKKHNLEVNQANLRGKKVQIARGGKKMYEKERKQ
jgi:hypothetical protein